jgi:Zn-dependent protease
LPPGPLASRLPPGQVARGGVAGPPGATKPKSALRRAWERLVATLATIGALLAKFGALLIKLKYIGLVLSMLVSIAAYSLFFGWTFAACFVLLIFVHEMGHVVELRRQGVPATAPLFIPFLGAFVGMKGSPRSAFQEALSGLAGPLFGTAAAVVVAFWANATGSKFLMALAFVGFFMNLFNLLPMLPLDGGRAAAALHPAIWLAGLAGLVVWEFLYPSPVVPIVLILGGLELWRRWRSRNSPVSRAYYSLLPQQRLTIGIVYISLVAVTIYGSHVTYVARSFNW